MKKLEKLSNPVFGELSLDETRMVSGGDVRVSKTTISPDGTITVEYE